LKPGAGPGTPHAIYQGGREWRVDSSRFPISTTVTGVILDLDPGGLRELHWHPNADEWQYVIDGQVAVTMFGSHGRFRVETLGQGDVGYIPQGYGHSIENVGDKPCRVLIGFNSGTYQTIDLSQWIAGNPAISGNGRICLQGFPIKTCLSPAGMARTNNRHIDTAAWFEADAEGLVFWIKRE
jgi:oxalate decarboxylase/phosphoglucose isomerase-like protein (cupin superfamily)